MRLPPGSGLTRQGAGAQDFVRCNKSAMTGRFMTQRRMRLGLSLRGLGYHIAAWRHPEVPAGGSLDFDYFLASTRAAARIKATATNTLRR